MIGMAEARLDYSAIIEKHPWIISRGQNCILSPDSDGLLSGLFMANYFDWKVCGFYDGKVLVKRRGVSARKCIFLDMEIVRREVWSIGQHMLMYDKTNLPPSWRELDNCISANNLRNFDYKHNFKSKYPFATIHLLLAIVGSLRALRIPTRAISVLLYTDGTFKNLFNYPENCLSWLNFLQADREISPLHHIFYNKHYSIHLLMRALRDIFDWFRSINGGKRGGDKIKISNTKGVPVNFDMGRGMFNAETNRKARMLLEILASKTGWHYRPRQWSWSNLEVVQFQKGSLRPSRARHDALLARRPLSFAITSSLGIEYTIDRTGKFK